MPRKGYIQTEEHKEKVRQIALKQRKGDQSPNWKGDNIVYSTVHDWVRKVMGKPNQCENCGTTEAKKFEWANISGEYKRDVTDYKRLCTKCHMIMDGTMNNLHWRQKQIQEERRVAP